MKTWKIFVGFAFAICVILCIYNIMMLVNAINMPIDAIDVEDTGNVFNDIIGDMIGAIIGPILGVSVMTVMIQQYLGQTILFLILSIILLLLLLLA